MIKKSEFNPLKSLKQPARIAVKKDGEELNLQVRGVGYSYCFSMKNVQNDASNTAQATSEYDLKEFLTAVGNAHGTKERIVLKEGAVEIIDNKTGLSVKEIPLKTTKFSADKTKECGAEITNKIKIQLKPLKLLKPLLSDKEIAVLLNLDTVDIIFTGSEVSFVTSNGIFQMQYTFKLKLPKHLQTYRHYYVSADIISILEYFKDTYITISGDEKDIIFQDDKSILTYEINNFPDSILKTFNPLKLHELNNDTELKDLKSILKDLKTEIPRYKETHNIKTGNLLGISRDLKLVHLRNDSEVLFPASLVKDMISYADKEGMEMYITDKFIVISDEYCYIRLDLCKQ